VDILRKGLRLWTFSLDGVVEDHLPLGDLGCSWLPRVVTTTDDGSESQLASCTTTSGVTPSPLRPSGHAAYRDHHGVRPGGMDSPSAEPAAGSWWPRSSPPSMTSGGRPRATAIRARGTACSFSQRGRPGRPKRRSRSIQGLAASRSFSSTLTPHTGTASPATASARAARRFPRTTTAL
jgi:hypothetical protein